MCLHVTSTARITPSSKVYKSCHKSTGCDTLKHYLYLKWPKNKTNFKTWCKISQHWLFLYGPCLTPVTYSLQGSYFGHLSHRARVPYCFPQWLPIHTLTNKQSTRVPPPPPPWPPPSPPLKKRLASRHENLTPARLNMLVQPQAAKGAEIRVRSLHSLSPALLQSSFLRSCEQWQYCRHILGISTLAYFQDFWGAPTESKHRLLGGNPLVPRAGYTLDFSPLVLSE